MSKNQITNFCKVFTVTDGNKVLYRITINEESEESEEKLCITTFIYGAEICVSLSNSTNKNTDFEQDLKIITQDQAQEFYNRIKSLTE